MHVLTYPARDVTRQHRPIPLHPDQIMRADTIAKTLLDERKIMFKNPPADMLRFALVIGLSVVTWDDANRRRDAPRSREGCAARSPVCFPRLLVLRASDLALAIRADSASSVIRGAIDRGLDFYASLSDGVIAVEPEQHVPWLATDSG